MPELQSQLLTLQTALKRRPDAHGSELSQRQVEDVMSGIAQLTRLATGTPLEDLVRRIRVDAEQQQKRLASAASRANELMNSPAPDFSLTLVGGGKLDASALKGKTVVLHFWDYRDAPLSEPYGQTGYLEFLFSQKKKMNVEVVGVSTNPDLQTPENLGRGRRSARKLSEFIKPASIIEAGCFFESVARIACHEACRRTLSRHLCNRGDGQFLIATALPCSV